MNMLDPVTNEFIYASNGCDEMHELADTGNEDINDDNNLESNLRRRKGKIISCAKETIEQGEQISISFFFFFLILQKFLLRQAKLFKWIAKVQVQTRPLSWWKNVHINHTKRFMALHFRLRARCIFLQRSFFKIHFSFVKNNCLIFYRIFMPISTKSFSPSRPC